MMGVGAPAVAAVSQGATGDFGALRVETEMPQRFEVRQAATGRVAQSSRARGVALVAAGGFTSAACEADLQRRIVGAVAR
jgi:hypothetical protein